MNAPETVWPTHLLNTQEASEVLTWLQQVKQGTEPTPTAFNFWLGLLESAISEAQQRAVVRSQAPDLNWARVALAIYDYWEPRCNPQERERLTQLIMNLRLGLIGHYGAKAGDPLLDPDMIVRWVRAGLKPSRQEVLDLLGRDPRQLPPAATLQVGVIQDRLRILNALVKHGLWKPDPELDAWLALQDPIKAWMQGQKWAH